MVLFSAARLPDLADHHHLVRRPQIAAPGHQRLSDGIDHHADIVGLGVAIASGTVVVIDPAKNDQVLPATQPYDTRVAGVISAQPGIILGEAGADKAKVAHSGRVKVKVDAAFGPIQVGDLLVSSGTPGYAMVSRPIDFNGISIHRPSTIVGKALEPLKDGQGEILVLLTLQ